MKFLRPEYLSKGDRIAIVAPSYSHPEGTVERACRFIRECGYIPVPGPNSGKTGSGIPDYAGSAEERAAELREVLESPEYGAILCTRGGYGAIHLLNLLPAESFRRNPKWLIGFSDITTLHSASLAAGVMSIHGKMCKNIGDDEFDILEGRLPRYEIPHNEFNVEGRTQGTLMGGNMISMAALTGGRYDFLLHEGIILFVEEVGEGFHAIDRLMNMLLNNVNFRNVKGLVFGEFTDCPADLPFSCVEQMLDRYTKNLGIPVCYGFPSGHGEINLPFIEGAEVSLKVTQEHTQLTYLCSHFF